MQNNTPARLACKAIVWAALVTAADAGPAVRYEVSLAGRAQQMLRVRMRIDGLAGTHTRVALPAWNALYQIRDFSQYLTRFDARSASGRQLPSDRIDRQTWQVNHGEHGQMVISYDFQALLPGSFGAEVDGAHAFLNGAMYLLYLPEQLTAPSRIAFHDVPADWEFATSLPSGTVRGEFLAADYDQLVDSPVEIGRFARHAFEVALAGRRVAFDVVIHGGEDAYRPASFLDVVRRIVQTQLALMSDAPLERYLFIYHITEKGGGGMEHRDSTAIELSRQELEEDVLNIAPITAHEFFHIWNVKRIRPKAFDRMDYSREVHTRALWFSEGCTSYITGLVLVRAGLWDEARFRKEISDEIASLHSRPGRLIQSAEDASWDTWYDKYPTYKKPERSISYYNKGHLLGLLLDLKIRDLTDNRRGLEDLFRFLNWWFAKRGVGFAEDELARAATAIAESDLSDFFRRFVSGTEELPLGEYLAIAGWRVHEGQVQDLPGASERQRRIRQSLLHGQGALDR